MNDTVITCSFCDHIYQYIYKLLHQLSPPHKDEHHHTHTKEVELIKNKYIHQFTCGICLDSNDAIRINRKKNYKIITPCGHIFHKQCLRKWLQTDYKKICPTCRTKIAHYKIFL